MRTLIFLLLLALAGCSSKTTLAEAHYYKTGRMVNGVQQGKWMYFFNDGTLYQKGHFRNGLQEGKWKIYHPNKAIRQIGNFKKDKMTGEWRFFHPNKQLYGVATFVDGKFDGICKWYFNNGQIHTIRHFEGGKLLSVEFAKDRSGNDIDKGTISNGNGTLLIYETETDKDSLVDVITYRNGEIVR